MIEPCPECDSPVSDKAVYCPSCGVPLKQKGNIWFAVLPWIAVGIVIGVGVSLIVACLK